MSWPSGTPCPTWPADWHREALIRPDRLTAVRELLCPRCRKTGHYAGDCPKLDPLPIDGGRAVDAA